LPVIAMVTVILAGTLGACADSDSQRQFANNPQPTEDLVGQPAAPASTKILQPTSLSATPLPLVSLVAVPGTAKSVFIRQGNDVYAVSLETGSADKIFSSKNQRVRSISASASGDLVAILADNAKTGKTELHVISANGKERLVSAIRAGGTPEPGGFGLDTIAWSPQADRLLITLGAGGIVEAQLDGSTRTILSPSQAPSPRAVSWSPTGNAIAFVDAGPNHSATGLYVASLEVLPLDTVTVIRPIEGRSRQIQEISWIGGDVGIVYSERSPDGDLSIGGDLFAVSASGGSPRLLGTAGGVSEIGAVGSFAVSPNDQAVAYSILQPSDNGPIAQKLEVRQIDGTSSIQLPVAPGDSVAAMAWAPSGIVWAVESKDAIVVYRTAADGSAIPVTGIAITGSPVASPKPIASPVAGLAPKNASPVPVASPVK
jgi:hypothetical protein